MYTGPNNPFRRNALYFFYFDDDKRRSVQTETDADQQQDREEARSRQNRALARDQTQQAPSRQNKTNQRMRNDNSHRTRKSADRLRYRSTQAERKQTTNLERTENGDSVSPTVNARTGDLSTTDARSTIGCIYGTDSRQTGPKIVHPKGHDNKVEQADDPFLQTPFSRPSRSVLIS